MKNGFSRRALLKGAAAAGGVAIGSGAVTGFPTIWAQNIKNITLRQVGTGVSAQNPIADKVKEDLGFTLQMTALDSDAAAQRVVTQPNSYDIADIEYWICKKVYPVRPFAADGRQEAEAVRQDRAVVHHRQADAGERHRPGHRAAHRRLRRQQDQHEVLQEADRMVHDGPHHLQRRHAGRAAGPGGPSDHQLEGFG